MANTDNNVNDIDMLFYSPTTMLCFWEKNDIGFRLSVNLFIKVYHKVWINLGSLQILNLIGSI